MEFPKNLKKCPKCENHFLSTWDNQIVCVACEPLRIDPEKRRILDGIARNVWNRQP